MTFDLEFSRSNWKKQYLRNGRIDCHGTKWMSVDRIFYPLCDLELWSWPWIFKIKFWNSRIPRMAGPIDMEWKRCELIGSWTHYATYSFNFTHDLGLEFSTSDFQIAISQEWESQLTWNERDVSPVRSWTHYATLDLQYGLARGLQHISNTLLLQLPTCRPINGLSILWSVHWGWCCSLNP